MKWVFRWVGFIRILGLNQGTALLSHFKRCGFIVLGLKLLASEGWSTSLIGKSIFRIRDLFLLGGYYPDGVRVRTVWFDVPLSRSISSCTPPSFGFLGGYLPTQTFIIIHCLWFNYLSLRYKIAFIPFNIFHHPVLYITADHSVTFKPSFILVSARPLPNRISNVRLQDLIENMSIPVSVHLINRIRPHFGLYLKYWVIRTQVRTFGVQLLGLYVWAAKSNYFSSGLVMWRGKNHIWIVI
jgi:hypothetical protein